MPTLKHNKLVAVKSTPLVRGQSIISQVKHRLKPLPVKALNARAGIKTKPVRGVKKVSVAAPKPRTRVAVVSQKQKPLSYRASRRTPGTKLRVQPRRPVMSRRGMPTGVADLENVKKLRGSGTGRILVIVGNGPSHTEAPLQELLGHSKIDFMPINKPDERIWPAAYWLFCDNSQYRRHKTLWSSYKGVVINSSAIRQTKPNSVHIKTLHGKGFSLNPTKGMYIGRSSTYASLQVAIYMGFDHIYVFGCDMGAVGGKLYPWGTNPDVPDKSRLRRFKYEAEHFGWMSKNVDKALLKTITFCSKHNKWPFIKKFECLDHIDAVSTIIKRHGNAPVEV